MTLKIRLPLLLALVPYLILAACDSEQPAPGTPTLQATATAAPQMTGAAEVEGSEPTGAAPQPPTPVPPDPREMVVCTAEEPADLYLYSADQSPGKSSILQAIYDGPMDVRSYAYEAVILEKVPSLADGDAVIERVSVGRGAPLVDADGRVTILEPGVIYHPAGCRSGDCALVYAEEDGSVQLDQLQVTFKLLPGLKWSDGEPLTAADSVYSFLLAADPDTPVEKDIVERTGAYDALDDVTVRWSGLPGYLAPAYFTHFWSPLPEHLWGGQAAAALREADLSARRPAGWGPFAIESWAPGSDLQLIRNPHYFRAPEGLPAIDRLVFRFVEETDAGELIAAGCDLLDRSIDLEGQQDALFDSAARGEIQLAVFQTLSWEHADFGIVPASYDNGWNFFEDRPDLFGDMRVRQAVAFCMDRQAVVDEVLAGLSEVIHSYMSAGHPLLSAQVRQYAFDVAAGTALLEEAGWLDEDGDPDTARVYRGSDPRVPPGTELVFRYDTSSAEQRVRTAEILVASLAECGIRAELEVWPIAELAAEGPDGPIFGRRFEMGQFAWENDVFAPYCDFYMTEFVPGGDFEQFPYFWGGWNNTGFSDPDYDAACGGALEALPGEPAYREAHRLAQEIFAERLPVVPLYMHIDFAVARPDLCGLKPDAAVGGFLWNIEELDYGGRCAAP